jgi:hypothetical protein
MNFHARVALGMSLAAILVTGPAYAICNTASEVFGTPIQTGPAAWTYNFSVQNGCAFNNQPFLTNFYIPYFADANIANITVPAPDTTTTTSTITWSATIDPTDDLFDLAGAGVIDFQVTATPELQASETEYAPGVGYYGASGFSFTSTFAPLEGPYAILQYLPPDYDTTTTLFGDPSIPGKPNCYSLLGFSSASAAQSWFGNITFNYGSYGNLRVQNNAPALLTPAPAQWFGCRSNHRRCGKGPPIPMRH